MKEYKELRIGSLKTQAQIIELLKTKGNLGKKDLLKVIGGTLSTLEKNLLQLVRDNKIERFANPRDLKSNHYKLIEGKSK